MQVDGRWILTLKLFHVVCTVLQVSIESAKQILQHARLTSASASPMFYETLRKLGKDVLVKPEKVDHQLLERLYPCESDSKYYRGFFGHLVILHVFYEHVQERVRMLVVRYGTTADFLSFNPPAFCTGQVDT